MYPQSKLRLRFNINTSKTYTSYFIKNSQKLNTLINTEHYYMIYAKKAENCSFFVIYKNTVKHMITPCIPKLLLKKIYFFSLLYIRMSGKNINFEDRKIKKVAFIKTEK